MRTDPPKIRVVAAVIERQGCYLIGRRPGHKRHGGLWEFPGGKIEGSESLLDAARRELKEELGVDVAEVAPVPAFSFADAGSSFLIEFVPTTIRGVPESVEHDELRWVSVAGLHHLELAPSDRKFAEFLTRATSEAQPDDD